MNALRTLPILNRPSRPSSPAPPSTTTTTAPGTTAAYPTDSVSSLDKPRSRSLSRQITDKVAQLNLANGSVNGTVHPSQPLGIKRASPPPSRPNTPRVAAVGVPPHDGTVGPQGGYMDVLGLRLNEAVNRACAGVDAKSKKPFKKGQGWSVGEAVVKELPYPPSDAYLIRAVLRTAVRSLSIYTTRLESLLLPALTDPAFANPLNLLSTPIAHPLNPSQYFALSVAHASWETCEVLEQTLETGKWPKFVQEALRPVMDKFDLIVGKVIQPLINGLKRDLLASLGRTDGTSPAGGKPLGLPTIPAPALSVPVAKEHSNQPHSRLTKETSGPGSARSLPIPTCLQHFASRVDGARKVLEIVAAPCADDGEGWITGVVVAVVWKAMCLVSEKDVYGFSVRPPSPTSVSKALGTVAKDSTPTVVASPSLGGVTAKLTTILPSRAASRPPSPSRSLRYDPMTHVLMSLEGLMKRLVGNMVQTPDAIQSSATEHIAREALHEALEALASFRIVSQAMHGRNGSSRLLVACRRLRDDEDLPEEDELDDALEDMPAVTLFTILLRSANLALASTIADPEKAAFAQRRIRTPTELWTNPAEYDRQVLAGFGAAEDQARRVALVLKPEVERILASLKDLTAISGVEGEKLRLGAADGYHWTRALGTAIEARTGVQVNGSA